MIAILYSVLSFVSTLLGGFFSLKYKNYLHYIMSFAAGVLIAVCFFDILPEIFHITAAHNYDIILPFIALILGYLIIHILEKYAVIHNTHEDEYANHRHPNVGAITSFGLIFHSFLDGVGIGISYRVDPHIGMLVAIAVIAHDFSDGLNTVSLMLINKNTVNKAKLFLVFDALAPILGVLFSFAFKIPDNILILYLGFFAGFLLYIGSSDLLPEAHSKHSSWKMIGLTLLGVVFIFFVTRFT